MVKVICREISIKLVSYSARDNGYFFIIKEESKMGQSYYYISSKGDPRYQGLNSIYRNAVSGIRGKTHYSNEGTCELCKCPPGVKFTLVKKGGVKN